MRKTSVQTHYSCSMQKTAPKTANIGEMRAFWKWHKNGYNAKPIAHAKYSIWVKK